MSRFYIYFKSPTNKIAGYRWFYILVCLAFTITLIYLIFHWMADAGW